MRSDDFDQTIYDYYYMNVGFFVRHFTERGTEVAVYDYARYNEEILHNKSYIICFSEQGQRQVGFPTMRHSFEKFRARFPMIIIDTMDEMSNKIDEYNLSFFYTLTHGSGNDIYQFDNKNLWKTCKTIKHCVFHTDFQEGDFYFSIGEHNNTKYNTNIPIIPHIVDLPDIHENLRDELQIPQDALVIGRHGSADAFDIQNARNAVIQYINQDENLYFVLMNTSHFHSHPRIIYLDMNVDCHYKTKFINTCDAMLHARGHGETFGLSVAEFSVRNKPIITCKCGDLEHIKLLGDKAILYDSTESLVDIFKNLRTTIQTHTDWNCYRDYSPQNVMNMFKTLIFDL